MTSRRYLLLLVFTGGMCTLGLELAASNLLAPYFGTSRLIWANVIGLTLLYLTIGYTVGGRLADRRPHLHVLCSIMAAAGLWIIFIPLIARPILRWSMEAFQNYSVTIFFGSLFGVLVLLSVPLVLLGMVSPFAIRLDVRDVEKAGSTAGGLYALSTIGSLLGTFLPTLVLTPIIGTSRTIYLFGAILMAAALPGLLMSRRRALAGAIGVGLLLALGLLLMPPAAIKAADCERAGCTLVYEGESAYNYIQVATRPSLDGDGDDVYLILNEGQAIHSIYKSAFGQSGDPRDLLTEGPWDFFNVAPFFYPDRELDSVTSLAMIGSAAGTVPKQFLSIYGADSLVDSVEIDPQIVQMGRTYFAMEDQDPAFPNYTTHVADGRVFIATTDQRYDVIGMDAYHQPYIPFHLTTEEFFRIVQQHLTPNGVAVVNAGKPGSDYRLVYILASTMKKVYPQVFLIDVPSFGNTMVIGVNAPVGDGVANFTANAQSIDDPALREIMADALASNARKGPVREFTGIDPFTGQGEDRAFTDDWAPVESLIDEIIVDTVQESQ